MWRRISLYGSFIREWVFFIDIGVFIWKTEKKGEIPYERNVKFVFAGYEYLWNIPANKNANGRAESHAIMYEDAYDTQQVRFNTEISK